MKDEDRIADTIIDSPPQLWQEEYAFVKKHHDIGAIESNLISIYEELLEANSAQRQYAAHTE